MNNAEQVANAVANFFSVRGFESRRFGESVDVFGEKGDFEVEVDEEFASVEGTVECFGESVRFSFTVEVEGRNAVEVAREVAERVAEQG